MADAPKRIVACDYGILEWEPMDPADDVPEDMDNTEYVRADIADEHKRQRDLLLVFLQDAVRELQDMLDCAEGGGDGSLRWRESKQADIDSFSDAIAECDK